MTETATNPQADSANFSEALKAFRAEIDALDEQLMALILKRSHVVKQVGKLKESAGEKASPMRPAREAAQLNKMFERFAGEAFPAAAATHIWRHIINGSLTIEGALSVGVCSPVGGASDLVWMAREYFGGYAEIARESQPRALVNKVSEGQMMIGILPYPTSEDTNPWWLDLAGEGENKPSIFLKLPHLPAKHNASVGDVKAFAIAKIVRESYGDDCISALSLRTENNCSMGKLQQAFKQVGIEASWVSVAALGEMGRAHFVEMKGDITNDDARLNALREQLGQSLVHAHIIGHYAAPISQS
jgi:chorismate mutase